MAILLLNVSERPKNADAFSFLTVSNGRRYINDYSTILSSTTDGEDSSTTTAPRKKPLSPKEVLERQRAMQGLSEDEDDEYPKLFDDGLLDNMQQMLLTLEKRVQDGPGSLSILEVEEFITMSQAVSTEMKEKERQRLQDAAAAAAAPSVSAANTVTTPIESSSPTTVAVAPPPPAAVAPPAAVPPISATPLSVETPKSSAVAESDNAEDGPAYDPSGGQGSLAKGTRNTYVIPNMDEMSPEEYQKALQKSLFDQQLERRKRIKAGYGNRASWDYLNNLTGESGQLKADSAFEDKTY